MYAFDYAVHFYLVSTGETVTIRVAAEDEDKALTVAYSLLENEDDYYWCCTELLEETADYEI